MKKKFKQIFKLLTNQRSVCKAYNLLRNILKYVYTRNNLTNI